MFASNDFELPTCTRTDKVLWCFCGERYCLAPNVENLTELCASSFQTKAAPLEWRQQISKRSRSEGEVIREAHSPPPLWTSACWRWVAFGGLALPWWCLPVCPSSLLQGNRWVIGAAPGWKFPITYSGDPCQFIFPLSVKAEGLYPAELPRFYWFSI